MFSQPTQPASHLGVGRYDHPAFASRQQLPRVEAEGGQISARTDRASTVLGARRAGGILHDRDSARLAKLAHLVQVGGDARLVHEDYGTRALRQYGFDCLRRQIERPGINLGENGASTDVAYGIGGGDK